MRAAFALHARTRESRARATGGRFRSRARMGCTAGRMKQRTGGCAPRSPSHRAAQKAIRATHARANLACTVKLQTSALQPLTSAVRARQWVKTARTTFGASTRPIARATSFASFVPPQVSGAVRRRATPVCARSQEPATSTRPADPPASCSNAATNARARSRAIAPSAHSVCASMPIAPREAAWRSSHRSSRAPTRRPAATGAAPATTVFASPGSQRLPHANDDPGTCSRRDALGAARLAARNLVAARLSSGSSRLPVARDARREAHERSIQ